MHHAAFLPRVIDLIETIAGHTVQMWCREDRETLCDLFHKGLWDFEAIYMDKYFSREFLLSDKSKKDLVE